MRRNFINGMTPNFLFRQAQAINMSESKTYSSTKQQLANPSAPPQTPLPTHEQLLSISSCSNMLNTDNTTQHKNKKQQRRVSSEFSNFSKTTPIV